MVCGVGENQTFSCAHSFPHVGPVVENNEVSSGGACALLASLGRLSAGLHSPPLPSLDARTICTCTHSHVHALQIRILNFDDGKYNILPSLNIESGTPSPLERLRPTVTFKFSHYIHFHLVLTTIFHELFTKSVNEISCWFPGLLCPHI